MTRLYTYTWQIEQMAKQLKQTTLFGNVLQRPEAIYKNPQNTYERFVELWYQRARKEGSMDQARNFEGSSGTVRINTDKSCTIDSRGKGLETGQIPETIRVAPAPGQEVGCNRGVCRGRDGCYGTSLSKSWSSSRCVRLFEFRIVQTLQWVRTLLLDVFPS